MDTSLKHRIVGALVLLALAVIFLPEVLDGKKNYRQSDFAPMPDTPAVASHTPEVVFIEPEVKPTEAAVNGAETAAETVAVGATANNNIAEDVDAGDTRLTQYKKNAWVIQLGVFKNRENVIKLVTQLRKQGFRAFTKPSRPKSDEVTRVYVGPDLSESKLRKLLPELKEKTNLQGKIYPYNPLTQ